MRLLELVSDRLVLLQRDCWFAVGNAALKAITLHEICGEGYHLNMVIRLRQQSKIEVRTVIWFLNARICLQQKFICWSELMGTKREVSKEWQNGVQISKPEESVQKIVREAAVPQLPAQLLQFQLERREGDPIVTGPL